MLGVAALKSALKILARTAYNSISEKIKIATFSLQYP